MKELVATAEWSLFNRRAAPKLTVRRGGDGGGGQNKREREQRDEAGAEEWASRGGESEGRTTQRGEGVIRKGKQRTRRMKERNSESCGGNTRKNKPTSIPLTPQSFQVNAVQLPPRGDAEGNALLCFHLWVSAEPAGRLNTRTNTGDFSESEAASALPPTASWCSD